MRAAGLAPDGRYLVVAMYAEAGGRMGGPGQFSAAAAGPGQSNAAAAGPGRFNAAAEGWRCGLAEELAGAAGDRWLLAPLGDEIIVLVPLTSGEQGAGSPDDGTLDDAPEEGDRAAHEFADRLREMRQVIEADRSRLRVTVGVSATALGVVALPGALHEARSARRLASLADPIAVVTSDEVASHELLLASVPGSVLRSFRERLLGPLVAYDEQHRAELLPTLREFLACSGSWNACAARMYVHVNTVRYRIGRIEELTGRDLSGLGDRVDFFLALRVR